MGQASCLPIGASRPVSAESNPKIIRRGAAGHSPPAPADRSRRLGACPRSREIWETLGESDMLWHS